MRQEEAKPEVFILFFPGQGTYSYKINGHSRFLKFQIRRRAPSPAIIVNPLTCISV
jgi:hypothetical protein